ncbi:unnamed protein product, partial [Durusdinium trenchii]
RRDVPRIDKNVKRSSADGDTMTAWLSKRRKVVHEMVKEAGDLNYIEDEDDLQDWSESHQKELEFQQGKALKSQVEAYNFNGLLDHEITDSLKEAAQVLREKDRQKDKEMVTERRKAQTADLRMTMTIDWSQLAGKDDALQTFNMVRTNDRIKAGLFIVSDPTSLPERVQWAAALVGGWVTEPSGLLSHNGIVLKYKRAIRTQKKVLLTEGFRNGHLEISALIVDSIDFHKPKNGWRITMDASK